MTKRIVKPDLTGDIEDVDGCFEGDGMCEDDCESCSLNSEKYSTTKYQEQEKQDAKK